ncbi:MAG: zinc ribbon domain-containing protein [Nitrososphaeria archaeon]
MIYCNGGVSGKKMNAIELEAQEYGMKAYETIEYNTSIICAYHNNEAARSPGSVIKCSLEHELHSDLNLI